MTRRDDVLRYSAFAWMMLVGVLGGAFVIGETFDDPGGGAAVLMVSSWLLPLIALATLALVRPRVAERVFLVTTIVVAAFTIADSAFGIVPRDDWGPVAAIVVFALAVATAFLGLPRPTLAGVLLMILGAAQAMAVMLVRTGAGGDRAAAGASSSLVILPILVGGALFLLAGRHQGQSAGVVPRHLSHT